MSCPVGLTIARAVGQWRDPMRKRGACEQGKLVTFLTKAEAKLQQRIDAIVAAYKRRFRQQSAAVVVRQACVSF